MKQLFQHKLVVNSYSYFDSYQKRGVRKMKEKSMYLNHHQMVRIKKIHNQFKNITIIICFELPIG